MGAAIAVPARATSVADRCEVCRGGPTRWSSAVLAWRCADHAPPDWCTGLPPFLAWAEASHAIRADAGFCEACNSYLCGHPGQTALAAEARPIPQAPEASAVAPADAAAPEAECSGEPDRVAEADWYRGSGVLDGWPLIPNRCWACGERRGRLGYDPFKGFYCARHVPVPEVERRAWLRSLGGEERETGPSPSDSVLFGESDG